MPRFYIVRWPCDGFAYRKLGADLQVLVHRDMATHWAAYPHTWGLSKPDTNIDHRRVPNLETFFSAMVRAWR